MKQIPVAEAKKLYIENNKKVIDDSVQGFVVLKDMNKVYGNRVQAVFNFNLSVEKNEFIVLVGPSGCGKSTTLRMIAGLEEITDGQLYIDNVLANYLESKDRDIAMVFQSYALYPNMSVYDNIGFGLSVRGLPKEEIKERVFKAAEILDLGPYLDRKPKELSGGQMQRVALGRAIVRDAKLFLMDEPLSNLDAKLRVQMRSEIVKLHKNVQATTIYVTHDQTEAMTMADRIVIMNQGVVQQIGTPIEVYNNPANVFVATFIGNPPMNVFKADIGGGTLKHNSKEIPLPKNLISAYHEFISKNREFFANLKQKAQKVEENAILEKIASLKKNFKRLSEEEVKLTVTKIVNETQELSASKGFISFTKEEGDSILEILDKANKATLFANLEVIENLIKNTDLYIAGILKEYDSAGAMATKKEVTIVSKKVTKNAESLQEENNRKIDEYIEKYASSEVENFALIGIRPEDVYFYDKFDGNKSEPVNTKADLIELLGSDYCMHANMFGVNVIIKRAIREVVGYGEDITLCLDLDKIKIFDPVSGKSISLKK